MNIVEYQIQSKVGTLYLIATSNALQAVSFQKHNIKSIKILNMANPAERILAAAAGQLDEYFDGKRKEFSIHLNLTGTAFQLEVWRQLTQISFGQTVSYSDIAQKIKNPKAVRAVGCANGKNPFCIIIPCHRVIKANGSIGGYAGGTMIKQQLLQLEKERTSL